MSNSAERVFSSNSQQAIQAEGRVARRARVLGKSIPCKFFLTTVEVVIKASTLHQSAVTCDSCAAACCRLEVLLIGDNDVPSMMTEQSSWGGEVMRRRDDGWCTALNRDTMLCTIYAQRPQVCRDFEMGGFECLEER